MLNILLMLIISCGSKRDINKEVEVSLEVNKKPSNTDQTLKKDNIEDIKFRLLTEDYRLIDKSKLGTKSLQYFNQIEKTIAKLRASSLESSIDLDIEDNLIAEILKEFVSVSEEKALSSNEHLLSTIAFYYSDVLSFDFNKIFDNLIKKVDIKKVFYSHDCSGDVIYLENLLYQVTMNPNLSEDQELLILDIIKRENIEFTDYFKSHIQKKNKSNKRKERKARQSMNETRNKLLASELVKLGSDNLAAIREEPLGFNLSKGDAEFSFKFDCEDVVSESDENTFVDSLLNGSFSIITEDDSNLDLSAINHEMAKHNRSINILQECDATKRLMKYMGVKKESGDDSFDL